MKKLTLVFHFILITLFCSGKSPAFILYDDGTWEKAGGGSFDLSSSSSGNSSMGSLEVLATLKMQRGGAKPVSSEDVYLTTKSAKQMVLETGYNKPLKEYESYIEQYSWYCTYPGSQNFIPFGNAVVAGLEKYTVQQEVTDLQGKAEFIRINPGTYYVILRTSLGAEWGCAWSVPIIIKPGRNKINLRNENVNEDLLHKGITPPPSPSTSPSSPTTSLPSVHELPQNPEEPGFDLDPEAVKKEIVRKFQAGEITREEAVEMMKKLSD